MSLSWFPMERRLLISQGCVIDGSAALTRVVCAALSNRHYDLLCDGLVLRRAIGTTHAILFWCGWCGQRLEGSRRDLCEFCKESLRGW